MRIRPSALDYYRLPPGPRSPGRRISRRIHLNTEEFLKNALPVSYIYTDSPSKRRRPVVGIEKEEGTTVGIPPELQHADGRRSLIKDESIAACVLVCVQDIDKRLRRLEDIVLGRRGPWSPRSPRSPRDAEADLRDDAVQRPFDLSPDTGAY